ncbi:MAG: TolC family protein [Xenococcaceae cyanobacterium MO_188.B29]|nr:TolC family protein [Xenococcaceae cyanobacterium MO_188.B29]
MDKSKSFLKALSASAFIFLGWETLAVAQNLPKSGEYYRSKDFLLANSITVSEDGQKEIMGYQKIPMQISQSTDVSQPSELTGIEPLEPNSNPLIFPTQPEEVEINLNQPITLEEAIELALRNNRDLQEATLNLQQAEEQLREARAGLYPRLDAQLELENQDTRREQRNEQGRVITDPEDPDGVTRLTSEGLATSFSGNVALNYDIYSGGEVSANIKRAERVLRSNELDLERITEQTRFEATRDYYSLQNANAEVEIAQAAIEESSQTLKDAQLLEQAGLRPQFDVLTAEVELANDQQTLARAIANQKTAQRTLAETLSIGQQVALETADEIEEAGVWSLSLEETIVLAYKNRAELEQRIVLREANEQQRKIALAEIRPRVTLFADYTFSASDIFEELEDFQERDNNTYRFGARLNWRLFDGGRAKARADQAETDTEINENDFANQRNTIRLEVESAYFSLEANQENIGTSQKALELAEESLRLARLRFQAGVGTQTEVIEAQSDLTTARANLLRAVIDYNQSLNQLQRAVTNLPDGLLFDLP